MRSAGLVFMCATLLAPAMCQGQSCQPYWVGLSSKSYGEMVAHDDGSGLAVFVTGFVNPGYIDPVRRWNGHVFLSEGVGLAGSGVEHGFSVLDDGSGSRLHYIRVLPNSTRQMVRRAGNGWEAVHKQMFEIPFPNPGSTVVPEFYSYRPGIAGLYGFMLDRSVMPAVRRVTRWEGDGWKKLGTSSASGGLRAMAEYFVDGRWNLLVSGDFSEFQGLQARALVRWDGQHWHSMGQCPGTAHTMVVWDDGTGPSLYIGFSGQHLNTPPFARQGIARWTGSEWVSVGGGVLSPVAEVGRVDSIVVFDDGSGPALFVAGSFSLAGGIDGVPARNIAKWDGQQWHALGLGIAGGFPEQLAVADDGRGPSLFVSGLFSSAGGGTVSCCIAQYVGCAGNRQCYPDCDNNRHLNANDFQCFLNKFAARDPYANCDVSTVTPAINAADFSCFLNKYAAGCS